MDGCGGAWVESASAEDVFVRNGGIGEHGVLEAERLTDVGQFDGGAIDFERFDDLSTEGGKMRGDGFVTICVED
jgi:hypothetical protein